MHLAILMTNTDESAFAQRHDKDGVKFTQLIQSARPHWTTTTYAVKDGLFPDTTDTYDGIMITGSPASVHDTDPWVAQLFDLIRKAHSDKIPIFGACYGHQAVAMALGGSVGPNPGGWVFGTTTAQITAPTSWTKNLPQTFHQYGAHIEQVTKLPDHAQIIATTPDCPVAGFRIGSTVYTTQNHPEMTPDFIEALVTEYADKLPPDVAKSAQASLAQRADFASYAETIAQFFELALAN